MNYSAAESLDNLKAMVLLNLPWETTVRQIKTH